MVLKMNKLERKLYTDEIKNGKRIINNTNTNCNAQ